MIIGYENTNLPENSIGYAYLPATIIVGLVSSVTAKYGVKIAHRMKQKLGLGLVRFMLMALNLLMR